ncbi:hypothetical protein EXIGLDRAFT_837723 [Exidia glandulosa HHB12029]|uniref:Ricin B lectin domain-containing protein n=1 Tax=Exidia glandulosa HHB12029 TaxID=1314781 RepID=A0A165GI86_EXIGL|nr:hypothetical protein EXIGLDRAFT_837723 [Exidia glandulosa HHB12029]
MFSSLAVPVLASFLVSTVGAQVSPGIYRFGSRQFPQALLSQSGSNIEVLGGTGAATQTWYIAPTIGNNVTILNAGTFQYLSLPANPINNTVAIPSNTPLAWTFASTGNAVAFGNLWLTSTIGAAVGSVTVTTGPPAASRQQWDIGAVTPCPSTYRLWNSDTNTYLAAGVPSGPLSASPSNPTDAAQLWRLAGTGPGSLEGTLQNIKTGAFLQIVNGQPTVATGSIPQWLFEAVGGGSRLSLFGGSPPDGRNVLTISSTGSIIVDNSGTSGAHQVWTFIPTNPSGAH